ncbi:hypothetical protein GCM10023156_22510 [Novipirellula rosea]|uniref:Uncharacterized protein n=1 Tax=Novipirellula rosea TaxID=1031540 RepID=A0ABP8MPC0_9BACT
MTVVVGIDIDSNVGHADFGGIAGAVTVVVLENLARENRQQLPGFQSF